LGIGLIAALTGRLAAQQAPAYSLLADTMVAMRDGIRLHTAVYVPASLGEAALPIVFMRTPYGIANAAERLRRSLRELAEDGYAFAFQDIRGHYGSEGAFVMQRPPRENQGDPRAVDEGTDAFDTIDWLIRRVPGNNGKVGMLGVSYDGWLVVQALMEPHPALAAASPQASPADMWVGDDFHHNGAFRLSYAFEYAYAMEQGTELQDFPFDRADTYDWYLALGPLSRVDSVLDGRIPTWRDFATHPDYDAFWRRRAAVPYLRNVTVRVPTLHVAGWWDQEDFYGPLAIYAALETRDTLDRNFVVVGPWNHGGWNGPGRRLGAIDFGDSTGLYFRRSVQRPFFACFLRERRDGCPGSEATLWRSGANRWVTSDAFPRRSGVTRRALYFREEGRLSFDAPTAAEAADSFVSDPARPVPYRPRPIQPTYGPGSRWSTWLLEDQRFVHNRPDVLSWTTEPLSDEVTVSGDIVARLFASTSGTDADWVVKLIDVYPEAYDSAGSPLNGFQLMVANEVFRGRYVDGFERPSPLRAGQVERFAIDLHPQEYTFRRGHRIMVQVQSTWFPIIDRNPQRYVPNIFQAQASDFVRATHAVHRSRTRASHVDLPVVTVP
jgi:putative CocE/NonD family hydrolase